jgi:hypothetical protein
LDEQFLGHPAGGAGGWIVYVFSDNAHRDDVEAACFTHALVRC